ncbi:hypothetical protein MWG61_13260 [Bacillus safensis]|uniref:hypothetical protein n=1 Tax=Bacillus safensis TaxID=561879 RepID=UPI0022800684|nr:hypothetical protein [Bacillus safensis]MCY7525108.1 hypothetical protein [Bacillus safensis]
MRYTQLFSYDDNGYFAGDVLITEYELAPANTTTVQPQGFINPKYVKESDSWVEGVTAEQLKELEENKNNQEGW